MVPARSLQMALAACALLAVHALRAQPFAVPPGPAARSGVTLTYIASDFRNGGAMGVYRGLEEAAQGLGWHVRLEDGKGRRDIQAGHIAQALEAGVDGLVFGGFDPDEFAQQPAGTRPSRTVLLGWHAAKAPGPTQKLFVNVSTRPEDVARIAADFVVQDAIARRRPVGVVIFNDAQFAVANAKSSAMARAIQACTGWQDCRVLSVENVPISDAATAVPALVPRLLAMHGAQWTYSLAINDIYFDEINYPLLRAQRPDIFHVSAGDGSVKALGRIGAGVSRQLATVAEPLKQQGYQLVDELNRALAGAQPSGVQSQPILVTTELLQATGTRGVEARLGFEAAYTAAWTRK